MKQKTKKIPNVNIPIIKDIKNTKYLTKVNKVIDTFIIILVYIIYESYHIFSISPFLFKILLSTHSFL